MMKILYAIFFVVILVVGFVLSLLNSSPIQLDYYYGVIELPLSACLVFVFLSGIFFGVTSGVWANIKLRNRCAKLSKEAAKAKKEVSNLRVLPVKKTNE